LARQNLHNLPSLPKLLKTMYILLEIKVMKEAGLVSQ